MTNETDITFEKAHNKEKDHVFEEAGVCLEKYSTTFVFKNKKSTS